MIITFGEEVNLEVEIFPSRLLSSETTKKVVRSLGSIPGVINIYLDRAEYSDGSDGVTKRLIVQIDKPSLLDKIDQVCEKVLPIGYTTRVGRFTKPYPTVSDYLKNRPKK